MIKERQRDKCGSVDKKGKSKRSASSNITNSSYLINGALSKNDILGNNVYIDKQQSFAFTGDIKDNSSSNSPPLVTCSFTDYNTFTMNMCPVDTKLDSNTFENSNLSACKSQVKTEDIIGADSDFPSDFMLDGVQLPPPCKQRKTDNVLNSDSLFPSDPCDGMLPSMVNKGLGTDAQYMQSNQIFVFSTKLINESAACVKSGAYKSIIEYHCAQPETKKFLQRNQLNVNQFNRQNSPQWMSNMNNLAMKHKPMPGVNSRCGPGKGHFRNNPMMSNDMMNHGCGGGPPPPTNMNMPSRMPMWNQQGNMNVMNSNNQRPQMCNNAMMGSGGPNSGPNVGPQPMNSVMPGQMGPNQVAMMHGIMSPMKCSSQSSSMDIISESNNANALMSNSVLPPHPPLANINDDQFPSSPRAQLTGIKVPDENLTPAERNQRNQKLATLKRLEKILMPENQPDFQQSQSNAVDDITSVLIGDNSSGGGGGGGGVQPVTLGGDGIDGGSTMPKTTMANNSNSGNSNNVPITPTDWQPIPSFFDERGKRLPDVSNMNRCSSSSRSQGPPPPYHQTTRSASVPISAHSPNPHSPGNTTSNLSLPSPRTCSGLSSPASKQAPGPSPTTNQMNSSIESPHNRNMNISNPGTPVSSSIHLSPNSKTQKDAKMCSGPMSNEFSPAASGQQSPGPDAVYSRSLQTLAARQQQQKQQPSLPHTQTMQSANSHCKEPPLMPVPSPQTITYLSSFEGQELIIQKQPNTSLKDSSNIASPSLSQAGLDSMIPTTTDNSCSKINVSAPNTPLTPSSLDLPSSKYPNTPVDFNALSPGPDGKPHPQMRPNNVNQMKNDLRFACNSPQMLDQQQRFQAANNAFMSQTNKNNFLDTSSPEKVAACSMGADGKDANACVPTGGPNFPRTMMPNNVPIDPTGARVDPISSLTQMSQQLNNAIPGSPGNPVGMMHSNMMPFNPNAGPGAGPGPGPGPIPGVGLMQGPGPNAGHGPVPGPGHMPPNMNMKPGPPMGGAYPPPMMGNNPNACMMRPAGLMAGGSYNNTNVQVKPNAPNTIQYMPNRPQSAGGAGVRGPPSLEFLRYSNPNAMSGPPMDKMQPPPHNMNYFQGNYAGGPPPGPNMNDMMGGGMNCPMPQGPGNPMMRGPAPVMRGPNGPPAPPNMMRMGGGNMGLPPYNDQMYGGPGPNVNMQPNNNCHMFMPGGPPGAGGPGPGPGGPKMPPMGMGGNVAPDATQPLPPSMGQPSNFKNSSYMGQTPEMNDPQYRQQFHNFQQQLYATNTRSQMSNQPMATSNQQYFLPK